MSFRLLYLTCEAFPTHNADLTALFGKYLPRLGLFSDIVTEAVDASDTSKSAVDWEGGDTLLCHAPINRALYHAVRFIHNIRSLLSCNPKKYDAIQVRDQPIVALFALIIAHHKKLPFYYWVSYPYPEAHLYIGKTGAWHPKAETI